MWELTLVPFERQAQIHWIITSIKANHRDHSEHSAQSRWSATCRRCAGWGGDVYGMGGIRTDGYLRPFVIAIHDSPFMIRYWHGWHGDMVNGNILLLSPYKNEWSTGRPSVVSSLYDVEKSIPLGSYILRRVLCLTQYVHSTSLQLFEAAALRLAVPLWTWLWNLGNLTNLANLARKGCSHVLHLVLGRYHITIHQSTLRIPTSSKMSKLLNLFWDPFCFVVDFYPTNDWFLFFKVIFYSFFWTSED